MKDIGHHLKHIQKKVLQSVRKDESHSKIISIPSDEVDKDVQSEISAKTEKRAASNHRVPRLVARSAVH